MNYGHFDDHAREYVITNPKTPTKWINYIGTLAFGGFVDHTGGALICKGDPALNRITKYIPQLPNSKFKGTTLYLRFKQDGGYKENAGVFCHTNPWIMIAEAILGRGDRAHDYYICINPSAREEISDMHRCEPYVYAQMIAGRDAPSHGEAKNSWLTGTAAWNYVAISQWILGIRPTLDGLQVAPAIPPDWSGFEATRVCRGATYHISVKRAGMGEGYSLLVDGQPIEGNIVPPPATGKPEVKVKLTLGLAEE